MLVLFNQVASEKRIIMRYRSGLSGIIVLLIFMLSGCASVPPLRVGTSPNYPPIVFMQDGSLQGVDPDLAKLIEKQTGRSVTFDIIPFNRLIPSLQAGQIDLIMAGMSITPVRQSLISFSDSYVNVGQMLLVRDRDISRFPKALFDRTGNIRVGVERGTTGEQYALKTFNWGTTTHYNSINEAVSALEQGTIDCFIHDAPTIWRLSADLATKRPNLSGIFTPLTDEQLAWGVRKGDQALLELLNTQLARMKREGTLQDVLSHWIRTSITIDTHTATSPTR